MRMGQRGMLLTCITPSAPIIRIAKSRTAIARIVLRLTE